MSSARAEWVGSVVWFRVPRVVGWPLTYVPM